MTARKAQMGPWMTGALVVGTMIGAGIFLLPASLAPLGANAIIGWIISSIGALCIAFALARLSKLGGDGIQANVERQLDSNAAFICAWSFWVSNWATQAALAIAGASALSWIDQAYSGTGFVLFVAIAAMALFTFVNALGARAAGGAQLLTVAIKILPLLAVILLLALRASGPTPFEPLATAPVNLANIASAVTLTFFALLGFEIATTPVGKIRDPARTIPRAIVGGTLFVALLYLFASSGVQWLLPAEAVANSPAPFAEVIERHWGRTLGLATAIAAAIAAFGALNGMVLATGELGYSMAIRRELPAFMARTLKGGTPVAAQIVGSVLASILILANGSRATSSLFTFLILLTTAGILVVYLFGAAAAWRLSPEPAARLILIGAFLFIALAFYGSGLEASLWCLVLIGAGLPVRALIQRGSKSDLSKGAQPPPG